MPLRLLEPFLNLQVVVVVVGAVQEFLAGIGSGQTLVIGTTVFVMLESVVLISVMLF